MKLLASRCRQEKKCTKNKCCPHVQLASDVRVHFIYTCFVYKISSVAKQQSHRICTANKFKKLKEAWLLICGDRMT